MSLKAKPQPSQKSKATSAEPKLFKASRDLWLAALVAVVIIVGGLLIGWDNNKTVIQLPKPGFHYLQEPHNPLSFIASWDAVDYLHIARHGYINLFWVNWFPLYPLAINVVHHIVPSWLDSALLISWLSLVGAVYFFIRITRRLFDITDPLEPLRAVVFFVLFPTAVFLIAPFSESLYALLALGAINFALQRKWLWAGLLALLCTATHITGVFVVILIALILWEEKALLAETIAAAIIGSLGLLTYMAYLYNKFGQPWAFLQSQRIYHDWAKHGLTNLLTTATLSNVLFVILLIVAAAYWWRRRKSFSIYSLLFLGVPLAGHQFGGFNRYVLMAFPVQLMFYGYFRDKKLYPYVMALLGIAWTYFLLQYAGGYIGG